jgi:hypothetical protein
MYAHDFVWGTQDRRRMPEPPGLWVIDALVWAARRLRARQARPS